MVRRSWRFEGYTRKSPHICVYDVQKVVRLHAICFVSPGTGSAEALLVRDRSRVSLLVRGWMDPGPRCARPGSRRLPHLVMAGLDPAIHVFGRQIPGSRVARPGMELKQAPLTSIPP